MAHYLGIEHQFTGRWGEASEKAFVIRYYGNETPQPILSNEHEEFHWLPLDEALTKVKFPANQEAIRRAFTLPPALLLNEEGKWEQAGETITHERTVQLLNQSLRYSLPRTSSESGTFYLENQNERWEVAATDTFLFAQVVDLKKGELRLQTGEWQKIPWENLSISKENILYSSFSEGKYVGAAIRFMRPAYYEIMKNLEVKNGYGLRWQDRFYSIRQR